MLAQKPGAKIRAFFRKHVHQAAVFYCCGVALHLGIKGLRWVNESPLPALNPYRSGAIYLKLVDISGSGYATFTSVNEIMCKNLLLEMKRDIENEKGLAKDV